jgi:hypothetical protein
MNIALARAFLDAFASNNSKRHEQSRNSDKAVEALFEEY